MKGVIHTERHVPCLLGSFPRSLLTTPSRNPQGALARHLHREGESSPKFSCMKFFCRVHTKGVMQQHAGRPMHKIKEKTLGLAQGQKLAFR